MHRSVAHGGERERTDKLFRVFRQNDINRSSGLLKLAHKLDRLITRNPPTYTDDNTLILKHPGLHFPLDGPNENTDTITYGSTLRQATYQEVPYMPSFVKKTHPIVNFPHDLYDTALWIFTLPVLTSSTSTAGEELLAVGSSGP